MNIEGLSIPRKKNLSPEYNDAADQLRNIARVQSIEEKEKSAGSHSDAVSFKTDSERKKESCEKPGERKLREKQIFGMNFRNLLKDRHLTQIAAAGIIGVTPKTVSDWCRGRCVPQKRKLARIAECFDVTEASLTEVPEGSSRCDFYDFSLGKTVPGEELSEDIVWTADSIKNEAEESAGISDGSDCIKISGHGVTASFPADTPADTMIRVLQSIAAL